MYVYVYIYIYKKVACYKVTIFVMVRMVFLPENFWAILLSERFFCTDEPPSIPPCFPLNHEKHRLYRRNYIARFTVGALE